MRRLRPAAIGAVTVLCLVLAGCGVPINGSPRAISKTDEPAPSASTTTTNPAGPYVFVTLVVLNPAHTATPVSRVTPERSDSLDTVLNDLLGWTPIGAEISSGLFTAIPPSTQLIKVDPNPVGSQAIPPSTPVTVDLSPTFIESTGLDQELAVEQVVFTVACDLGAATKVSFAVNGIGQPVPVSNGTLAKGSVTAADYGALNCTPS
ncbi:MAG: GerMN domain-containing protein [Acidimicrobiales bacterium]